MNPLLVSGFANFINVDGRKLVIMNKIENSRVEFLPHQIQYDTLVIDGKGSISVAALNWLVKMDVSVCILRWNGAILSTFLPEAPASARLRIRQYQKHVNEAEKYKIAKTILDEKIGKSYDLLVGLSNYYKEIDRPSLDKTFGDLKAKYDQTPELLTYEGNVAIFYWNQLGKVFNVLAPEFSFSNRNGRRESWSMNASNEICALQNYSFSIIESEVRRAINALGLDASISFLHEVKDGRSSLVYDIQELYRWVADLSVIQLLEEKKVKKRDFIWSESLNVRLKPAVAKALIEKIRGNLNARVLYNNRYCSYQNILYENVRLLANYIMGKSSSLKFNIPEIEMRREDDIDLRARLLSITPEERRKLGINKSTLWYVQKNIREGKRIKVYRQIRSKLH